MRLGLGLGLNRIALGGVTLTIDALTFTAGDPATLEIDVTYTGSEALTAYAVTGTDPVTVTADQLVAGSGGTNTLEFFNFGVTPPNDTDDITGLTGASSAADRIFLVIEDANGVRSAVEEVTVSGLGGYTEEGFEFNGTNQITSTQLAPDSSSMLIALNFDAPKPTSNVWIYSTAGAGGGPVRLRASSNGNINNGYIYNTSAEIIMNFATLVAAAGYTEGQRVQILIYAASDGTLRYRSFVDGTQNQVASTTVSVDGSNLDLDNALTIEGGAESGHPSTFYDFRVWTGLASAPDMTDSAFIDLFMRTDTGFEGHTQDPADANASLGTPIIQLDPSDGSNAGSGAAFTVS